jgi:hypothetical protein
MDLFVEEKWKRKNEKKFTKLNIKCRTIWCSGHLLNPEYYYSRGYMGWTFAKKLPLTE